MIERIMALLQKYEREKEAPPEVVFVGRDEYETLFAEIETNRIAVHTGKWEGFDAICVDGIPVIQAVKSGIMAGCMVKEK
jgi:hypothetical protein